MSRPGNRSFLLAAHRIRKKSSFLTSSRVLYSAYKALGFIKPLISTRINGLGRYAMGWGKKGRKMEENKENQGQNKEQENVKTFDEMLKESTYQSEFDKRVAKALETAKAKWEKEEETKRTEAENLARMSAEEKHAHEMSKLTKEKEAAIAKLNAYELKDEALKIAKEKGMEVGLLDLIDFTKETAESVKDKIDLISSTVAKATENGVNEKLKQPDPKQVNNNTQTKKEYSRASY